MRNHDRRAACPMMLLSTNPNANDRSAGPRAISSRCKLNRSHDCAILTPSIPDRRAGLRPRGGDYNNQGCAETNLRSRTAYDDSRHWKFTPDADLIDAPMSMLHSCSFTRERYSRDSREISQFSCRITSNSWQELARFNLDAIDTMLQ
jgi:hypothetical protein